MIVRMLSQGKSFKGLATYLAHDPDATSAERVAWTHTLNLAHDHVGSAVDEMLWTARNAELLKQEAGIRAGGRATDNTVKHVSLNWSPEENPTREYMIETAENFLRHMNWQEHQALLVSHTDKAHAHIHLMINTIHPETGLHLDDNFERRRAQKWALGYEQENGRVFCEQRLENIGVREKAPTRPAWMAFQGKQTEFERDEENRASQTPELSIERESPRPSNSDEWKELKDFQRQERMYFFAEGKSEFCELRRMINREVREEFRDQWAHYYSGVRSGVNETVLAAAKAELVADQKEQLETQRDYACEMLRTARDEQYRVLLEYQQDTRQNFRARQEAGLDNSVFLQLMHDGTLRDRWPASREVLSPAEIVRDMKREGEGAESAAEEREREAERDDQPESFVAPRNEQAGIKSGADIGASIATGLGFGLLALLGGIGDGSSGSARRAQPKQVAPEARGDPFDGAFEAAKRQQYIEQEEADYERRRKQRSYGE